MGNFNGILPLGLIGICLILSAGCGKTETASGEDAQQVSEADRTTWSMTRGGPDLGGRIQAAVPKNPIIKWTFDAEEMVSAEAAIAHDRVYVGNEYGVLFAIDHGTGKQVWRFATEDAITAAPAVSEAALFLPSNDGKLYALDPDSGIEIWQYGTDDKISASPVLVNDPESGDAWVLVNGYDGATRCLDAETGGVVWEYETQDFINGSPAVVDGRYVVFGGCDAQLHVVNLADGSLVRMIPTEAQVINSIATIGAMAFCGNYANQTVGFDVAQGKVTWVYEDRNLPFYSSPGVSEDLLFIGSRDKHLHAIDWTTGVAAWKYRTGARVEGSPIVFEDAVVFGSEDGRIYALKLDSGEEIWKLDLGEGLSASAAFGYGNIVISGEDGTVFALGDS